MPQQTKWNSDKIFRRTAERTNLYNEYVKSLKHPLVHLNITNCMSSVQVKGKLQPRAFDEKKDLWRATDFWREALTDKTGFREKHWNIKTLQEIEKKYISLQNHWLGIKFDGYLVMLYRTADGGWGMKTRRGVELYPDDGFLEGLAQNEHLPAVLICELLTGRGHELCAEEDRLEPEKRGKNRNSNFPALNRIFLLRQRLEILQKLFFTIKDYPSFTSNETKALISPNFTETHQKITEYLERSNNVTRADVTDILQVACGKIRLYLSHRPQSPLKTELNKILSKCDDMTKTASPWENLRVIVFAFPTLLRKTDTNRKDTFEMQYMTGLSIMEQTLHLHPHIGVCRFEKFDYKSVAFDYFQSVVKMGLEGLIVVDPRVPYKSDLKGHPQCFFKMKPKTVTKEWIPLRNETSEPAWKDGAEVDVSVYTVSIAGKDVTFEDMQANRNAHEVRIKWMEKCPGAPWPCRGEEGYRHMHIASRYDINIPIDNKALTPEQIQKVQYLMGRDRLLFNPVGFKSSDWNNQINKRQTAEDEPIPERQQNAMAGWQSAFELELSDEEAAGSAPIRTRPDTDTITIVSSDEDNPDGEPDPSKKRKSAAAPEAAGAAAKPKTPRQLPEWAKQTQSPPVGKNHRAKGKQSNAGVHPRAHTPTEDAHVPPAAADPPPKSHAPDETQDGGGSPRPPRPSVDEWLANSDKKDAADRAAREEMLANNSNGRLSYVKKHADISHLLRQLKLYSS